MDENIWLKSIKVSISVRFQSFVTLLGEELLLSLPSEEDDEEWTRAAAPTTKVTDPGSLVQEAKG